MERHGLNRSGKNGPLIAAVLLSVLAHALLLQWLEVPRRQPPEPVVYELVLTRPPATNRPAIRHEPEAPSPPPVAGIDSEPDVRPPSAGRVLPTPSGPALEKPIPETSRHSRTGTPEGITELNLQRPAEWDELVEGIPGSGLSLPFNPALAERVAVRHYEKRRQRLLANRRSDVYGVTDEQYARRTGTGYEMKQDGTCHVLVEEPSVEEGVRWWSGPCTDTRQRTMDLLPLEVDALGRAIPPDSGPRPDSRP